VIEPDSHPSMTTAVRTVAAPTEAEATTLAAPLIAAFVAGGWAVVDRFWVPGDRRPGLGESLLLSPASENLLDADGMLRITFATTRAGAIAPTATALSRQPDVFEALGGVRYRRLVPRWILGAIVFVIGLIVILAISGGMNGGAGLFGVPAPEDGICPVGWVAVQQEDGQGNPTYLECQRVVMQGVIG
jgi:hypothetical protein